MRKNVMKKFTVEGYSGFFNIKAENLTDAWRIATEDPRAAQIGGITAIRPVAKGQTI